MSDSALVVPDAAQRLLAAMPERLRNRASWADLKHMMDSGAVVVTRCRGCIHRMTPETNPGAMPLYELSDTNWWCSTFDHACGPDWFCKDGKPEAKPDA